MKWSYSAIISRIIKAEGQAEGLREMLGSYCSEAQEARLLDEVFNIERVKTPNIEVVYTLSTLNEAIRNKHKVRFPFTENCDIMELKS